MDINDPSRDSGWIKAREMKMRIACVHVFEDTLSLCKNFILDGKTALLLYTSTHVATLLYIRILDRYF